MPDTKAHLRREAIRRRDGIAPTEADAAGMVRMFFDTVRPAAGQVVALYHPKGREVDTLPLLAELQRRDITCALPVIADGLVMRFAGWRVDDPLAPGPFEVMQPATGDATAWVEPDIVVVPLLAFDRTGGRLGYGGGYYDATLADLRARRRIVAVGLGYPIQLSEALLPLDAHDQKLDHAVTPDRAYLFNG